MKISNLKTIIAAVSVLAAAIPTQAQVFAKGDRKVDLTIGVGLVAYKDESRATFDQHASMEWGVASVADKFTLGVGFQVNNSYGGKYDGMVAGEYDYTYTLREYGRTYSYKDNKWHRMDEKKEMHRKGVGTADASIAREDVNALATVALHFSPIPKLDTYVKVGAGVGYMTYIIGNYSNEKGFKSADHYSKTNNKIAEITTTYKYNDLDHVKWSGADGKVVPSMAAYIGATYMITDRWGADLQLGLVSANFKNAKKGYPNSYGIFSIGASYRF